MNSTAVQGHRHLVALVTIMQEHGDTDTAIQLLVDYIADLPHEEAATSLAAAAATLWYRMIDAEVDVDGWLRSAVALCNDLELKQ